VVTKKRNLQYLIAISIALVAVTLAVYIQVINHQFLFLDDNFYVTGNQHLQGGITTRNILWAITSFDEFNWHPVTWLSHMADVQIYGMNPGGHHLTSVIIHIVSSVLLLFLLFRVTGSIWRSSAVAALFALHPLHVESVAWVAERKDVLSAFFWILTLLFYAEYVKRQGVTLYLLALFSFMLGLMSKPMLVTLPLVMLLLDFWPFNRYINQSEGSGAENISGKTLALLREKLPFFICALFSGVMTIFAQHKGGATRSFAEVPFMLRVSNALVAYVKYIIKTLWPQDLAVLYPLPASLPFWQICGALIVLIIVTVISINIRRQHPYITLGWFWFLITLLPVIGLVQVGSQSMADRYTYIPHIGFFIMVVWGAGSFVRDSPQIKAVFALSACLVIIASAALTWRQLGYWRDSISLFRHAVSVTEGNYVIYNNLGSVYAQKGDFDAAIREYQNALRIKPDDMEANYNLRESLVRKRIKDAAGPLSVPKQKQLEK